MIRLAKNDDMKEIEEIYAYARKYMAEHGNPTQWGTESPREDVLKNDLEKQQLYVVEENDGICGVFAFITGEDPTYRQIAQGNWKDDSPYGTLHRIASAPEAHGIMQQSVEFASEKIGHLRIDTHEDNKVMQHLIEKNGFERCGIIYVADGTPRIAYEKTENADQMKPSVSTIKEHIQIRIATPSDAKELLDIYADYILKTAITFEYEVPTVEAFMRRMEKILVKYPYLVAEKAGRIVGYAYAGPLHARAAYDWAVETSIYVKMSEKKQGIGKRLYQALEGILKKQNIVCENACIACPTAEDDPYLTKDSITFHFHMGFRMVGEFHECAYKFDRWYHMVWMEKSLSERPQKPEPMIWFSKLRKKCTDLLPNEDEREEKC